MKLVLIAVFVILCWRKLTEENLILPITYLFIRVLITGPPLKATMFTTFIWLQKTKKNSFSGKNNVCKYCFETKKRIFLKWKCFIFPFFFPEHRTSLISTISVLREIIREHLLLVKDGSFYLWTWKLWLNSWCIVVKFCILWINQPLNLHPIL